MEKKIISTSWFELSSFKDDKLLKKYNILVETPYSYIVIKDKKDKCIMEIELSDLDYCLWKYFIITKSFYESLLEYDKKHFKIIKDENNLILIKDIEVNNKTLFKSFQSF